MIKWLFLPAFTNTKILMLNLLKVSLATETGEPVILVEQPIFYCSCPANDSFSELFIHSFDWCYIKSQDYIRSKQPLGAITSHDCAKFSTTSNNFHLDNVSTYKNKHFPKGAELHISLEQMISTKTPGRGHTKEYNQQWIFWLGV